MVVIWVGSILAQVFLLGGLVDLRSNMCGRSLVVCSYRFVDLMIWRYGGLLFWEFVALIPLLDFYLSSSI